MLRRPAVAGRFYPAEPEKLTASIREFLEPPQERIHALGVVVPHAGYMYSGHVAGAVDARVEFPPRNIVLCPHHTGLGTPLSILKSGAWQTPLGDMQIDAELCEALMTADPYLEDDASAHQFEHALEVQLPFMQHLGGAPVRLLPITIGTSSLDRLLELGRAISQVIREIKTTRSSLRRVTLINKRPTP